MALGIELLVKCFFFEPRLKNFIRRRANLVPFTFVPELQQVSTIERLVLNWQEPLIISVLEVTI